MNEKLKTNLREFYSSRSGKAGAILFLIFFIVSFLVILLFPLNFGNTVWSNPVYWSDNPKAAPPFWISSFNSNSYVDHVTFSSSIPDEIVDCIQCPNKYYYYFELDHTSDNFPTFLSFSYDNVIFNQESPYVKIYVERPDGKTILVYRDVVTPPLSNETPPYVKYENSPFRINLSGDNTVSSNLISFLSSDLNIHTTISEISGRNERIIFGNLIHDDVESFEALKGSYYITVEFTLHDQRDSIGNVKFVSGGSKYGFMGTDALGRDLALGLLYGFPVALFIGLVTSTLTTFIGTSLGIISGYVGGKTDIAIQRFSDILSNIPLLPVLIFLLFVIGPKLWLVMIILIAFGWPGLTIIVRSMVLQIRTGQSIESAQAIGASRIRIMYRHIFPQLAPFIFAQLIFFTPAAILAEASLSFLGLGDPSIPTWGQILENGFRTGGVYIGYWWWILPPGILIVLTAMIFVFIAIAFEPIVNPKIKKYE